MKISWTVNSSKFIKNPGPVYDDVLSGEIIEITNRSRKPMVLLTKADFLEMAKKAQG